jgi:hypothetical protein
MKRILIAGALFAMTMNTLAEKIITKEDTHHIFSLNRAGWEAYVKRMTFPESWKARTNQLDTGTGIMAYDASTGFGLSVQPLFSNPQTPPDMLIVGSHYPKGTLQGNEAQFKQKLKDDAEQDLGNEYSVSVSVSTTPSFETVELAITRNR